MLFPSHDELSRTYVGLKGQHFPLSLTVKDVRSFGMCNLDSPLRQTTYDQVPTGLWLNDLVWRKRGALPVRTLDLKVLIRGVVLT